jgi:hypothetical protein
MFIVEADPGDLAKEIERGDEFWGTYLVAIENED